MSAPAKIRSAPSSARLLKQLAREAAAHHAEYERAARSATPDVQKALRAALSFGCAIGLRRAAELIREGTL